MSETNDRPIMVPRLRDSEMIALGFAVQMLLKEIEECSVPALTQHGLEQHAEDLKRHAGEVIDAMEPLIESGDRPFWEAIGIHVDEDEEGRSHLMFGIWDTPPEKGLAGRLEWTKTALRFIPDAQELTP